MRPTPSGNDLQLLTVLYVGPAPDLLVDRLRDQCIGVLVVERVDRALRLLSNFRVAAVICDVPDLQAVAALSATHTPLVLLAAADAQSEDPAVAVVNRRTPAAALAHIIRRLADAHGDNKTRDAA